MMFLSLLIYLQLFLITLLYCAIALPLLLAACLFSGFRRSEREKIVRFFILWYGRAILYIALRPYVRIRFEDAAPEEQPAGIYIFNHRSASDPFLVSTLKFRTSPVQVVNRWPMRLPFFGFFARLGGYLDITSMNFEEAIFRTKYLLTQNAPLMIFPEGTRSGNREINSFHGTFFRIAQQLDCPIVPVAIVGNENIPDRNFRISCGTIRIRKLPAVSQELVRSSSPYQLKQKVRLILQEETRKLDEMTA